MPEPPTPRAIILMGVSGCGKTTFGELLKRELKFDFKDGDELHSPANVAKMASGQPLNDDDRRPWLNAICQYIDQKLYEHESVAVACSALKRSYRQQLRQLSQPPIFIHLVGSMKLISSRQAKRAGHYMPPELMQSQFDALEPTHNEDDVVEVSVELPLLEVERQVLAAAKR